MSILGTVKKLLLPGSGGQVVAASHGADPTSVSRRKFFSFFGVGAAMLAKPDLFLPRTNRFGVSGSNILTSFGLEVEFSAVYAESIRKLHEQAFFDMLTSPAPELLPNVPIAEDGAAIFSSLPCKVSWTEDAELKRLAGW